MKIQLLVILILTSLGFAKSYTVLDNRFNTPVESVLVVRLVDSSSVYTDSLGVFEFDEITPIQDIKKIENTQKWVDASGRVVVKPDPLRMKAFEVSSSEVVEFNSFKKVGFDFNLTRSGYDSKSVSDVDTVIVLNKQVLGDSILSNIIHNDIYRRRLLAWKNYHDSVRFLDSAIIQSIFIGSQFDTDSLNEIRDSMYWVEAHSKGWGEVNISNSLVDSVWVINENDIGYSLKGDTSSLCPKEVNFKYSFQQDEVTSLGDSCMAVAIDGSWLIDVEIRKEEVKLQVKVFSEKQESYVRVIDSVGYGYITGYKPFESFYFLHRTLGVGELSITPRYENELQLCYITGWEIVNYLEEGIVKQSITQPENCKWITE